MTSEGSETKICRYCLKEFNKISQHIFITDEMENFEKMVSETFNIQIHQFKSLDRLICMQCYDNLCLAAKVKQQILDVQQTLLEQYEINSSLGYESPKQELDNFDDYGYDDRLGDDSNSQVDDKEILNNLIFEPSECRVNAENNCSDDIDIKPEPSQVIKTSSPNKRKSQIKKKTKNHEKLCLRDAVKHDKRKVKCRKSDKEKPISTSNSARNHTRNESNIIDELSIVRNNTLKLLTNSNMCPFISKRTKFACCVCTESYLDIRKLREHSLSHSTDFKIGINRCRGMSYKNVDISNLSCKICSEPCLDINSLREHLINKHDVTFDSAEHFLLPFRLEDGFICVICQEKYHSFNRLSIHMNTHSTRNVCETCGVAYINRIGLRNHINSMHKEKNCTKCTAVFLTSAAKAKHMRVAHNNARSKRYCMKCEMTFTYNHQLKEHMIEKHGEKRQVVHCEHCGKKFFAVANLRVHVRSVHIGERKYPCSICDLRFFTSCDKGRHEKTHGDGKAFSCDYCEVKFRSKDSQRRHLKRQHGKSKISK